MSTPDDKPPQATRETSVDNSTTDNSVYSDAPSDAVLYPSESEQSDYSDDDNQEAVPNDYPLSVTDGFLKLSLRPVEDEEDSKLAAVHEGKEGAVGEDEDLENVPAPLRALASWIQDGRCQRIMVLSGAGVSVAAGIPDFRTPGTGLYDNLQKYNLPFPEAVFDLNYYRVNPQPFVSLAREMWPGINHVPTLTHTFVALLAEKKLLLRNYSQNIDGLEYLAETPADLLMECHGHYRAASCIRCEAPADAADVRRKIVELGEAPECAKCGGLVKPAIVFFGEALSPKFPALLREDKLKADLLLVLGTSLQVAPVSLIPEMVSDDCKRVLINRDLVGCFEVACNYTNADRTDEEAVEAAKQSRDLFVAGDCDDSIRILAKLLGWYDELKAKHDRVVANVRKQQAEELRDE